ncbi:covalently-linked cell wall protein [Pestalotiopsis sp. NC0098]|nr:covalently-linked cell wall protein [Pestalotiopsis sp. NC0098]
MKYAAVALAFVGAAYAQGVTDKIAPEGGIPDGCSGSFDGNFEITVAQVSYSKRDLPQRAECGANGVLVLSLSDDSIYDSQQRTGYIASNSQFQFDGPPQAGAIYTSGFSVCEDNLLALGQNKTFYRCLSGDFYNLYNEDWAEQCEPVSIIAIPCGSDDSVSQGGDGQVVGTTVVQTTIVTALTDGQPQVITTEVSVPVTSYFPTSAPVSQISDGQIQVPPPQTATSVATASVSSPVETGTAPAETGSATGSASVPAATGSSASASASASGSASATASHTSGVVTSATAGSSTAAGTSAATSAPASSGSSRTTTASLGALVVAVFAVFAL